LLVFILIDDFFAHEKILPFLSKNFKDMNIHLPIGVFFDKW